MEFKPRKGKRLVTRLHQSLARDIGTKILTGVFEPGDSLGKEIDEAELCGVSRSVYREAIRTLVAKGLLESRPKSGTRVTERSRWNKLDPDILEWSFLDKPDKQFVRDLFELRQVIEPAAAAFASTRYTDADLADMDRHLGLMSKHGVSTEKGRAADRDFHAAILTASRNEALETLASSIGAAVRWTTHFKQYNGGISRDSIPDHVRLRDAIASRSPDSARAAMEVLIDLSLADMGEWGVTKLDG